MDNLQFNALLTMTVIGAIWLTAGAIYRSETTERITFRVRIIHIGGAAVWLAPPFIKLWITGVL